MSPITTLTATGSALTAIVALFVTYLALRGYRRHESPTMGALALGIFFIGVIPFLIEYVFGPALTLSDAESILGITLSHTVGLVAIYRTFEYS